MFTKSKGNENAPGTPQQNPVQNAIRPASSKPTARTAPSIISSDMKITGSVVSDGEMQIDGDIDGDVSAAMITIGQTGSIAGEVRASSVTVRGRVVGSIRARKVELEANSVVEGDIVHGSLSIQANSKFEGQVKHAEDPLKQSEPIAAKLAETKKPAGSVASAITSSLDKADEKDADIDADEAKTGT